jgi:hypothetical protein
MFTVIPVTAPNVLSVLPGTETVPLTVIVYVLSLPPLLTPFTASIQVDELVTVHELVCEKPNVITLISKTVKIKPFFIIKPPDCLHGKNIQKWGWKRYKWRIGS